jgi:hypothetical protein
MRLDLGPSWQPPRGQPVQPPQPCQQVKEHQNNLAGEFSKPLMDAMLEHMINDMFRPQETSTNSQRSPAPTRQRQVSNFEGQPLPPQLTYNSNSLDDFQSPWKLRNARSRPGIAENPDAWDIPDIIDIEDVPGTENVRSVEDIPDVASPQPNEYDQYIKHLFGAVQQLSTDVSDGWHDIGRRDYDWNDRGKETTGRADSISDCCSTVSRDKPEDNQW